MADKSAIEWTDATWNPIRARNLKTGKVGWHCEHATTACEFCYAEGFNKRLGTGLPFKPGHRKDIEIFLDEEMLTQPLRWKKPRMIFVGSMTDLFADFVTDDMLDKIFAVMALSPRHTFQVLTKRAARMRAYCSNPAAVRRIYELACDIALANELQVVLIGNPAHEAIAPPGPRVYLDVWPLRNVWLGVSTERQQEADERIPLLLQTPAAVRFISAEPLLGPIELLKIPGGGAFKMATTALGAATNMGWHQVGLHWVIAGGESGPKARPSQADWIRSLRDQCASAGVAYHFKQWGEYLPVGQSLPGYGKVHGATAVKPGRMKLHYGGTPKQVPKYAFAERGVAFASTADNRLTFRVGKKASGRLLDGVEHSEFPVTQ
jgi:protein gp37